jgi:hypothetical protein
LICFTNEELRLRKKKIDGYQCQYLEWSCQAGFIDAAEKTTQGGFPIPYNTVTIPSRKQAPRCIGIFHQ